MVERVEYVVSEGWLVPHDQEAWAQFKNLRRGAVVDVELFQRRSRTFSNCLHLLFKRIGASKGFRVRNVRGLLMIATGRYDTVQLSGHVKPVPIPWSTSPGAMSAAELAAFWADARDIVVDDIIPTLHGIDRQEVTELIDNVDRHATADVPEWSAAREKYK